MQEFQSRFLDYCLQRGALKFGEFTLKSGRISPYFFNAGIFNTGADLAALGSFYAEAIQHANIDFDMLSNTVAAAALLLKSERPKPPSGLPQS